MTTANINVRTDAAVKAQAQKIFESIGLDLSTAVNLFLRQTVRVNDLPFVVGTTYNYHGSASEQLPEAAAGLDELQSPLPKVRRKPIYGCAKDKIWIADDFDAPLDDFKEYM